MSKHICLCCDNICDIDFSSVICPNCHSEDRDMFELVEEDGICSACNGTGEGKRSTYCHVCGGSGRKE